MFNSENSENDLTSFVTAFLKILIQTFKYNIFPK